MPSIKLSDDSGFEDKTCEKTNASTLSKRESFDVKNNTVYLRHSPSLCELRLSPANKEKREAILRLAQASGLAIFKSANGNLEKEGELRLSNSGKYSCIQLLSR